MNRLLVLALVLVVGVALAQTSAGGEVSLGPVVSALGEANTSVVSIRNGIILLLSSLLAIGLVVLLYKNIGGGK